MTINASYDVMNYWVFGYGSLIWNPGFAYISAQQGLLRGVHRSLSILSYHHRGTIRQPGLVFGLAKGGACRGMVFEVENACWAEVYAYLLAREQVSGVYREALRPVQLANGQTVQALTFLVNEHHEQFAGRLRLEQQLAMVRVGTGVSGRNIDYVLNTARHLQKLGIHDPQLMILAKRLNHNKADV